MTQWDWEFLAEKNMNHIHGKLIKAQSEAIAQLQKQLSKYQEVLHFYASGTSSRDWNELGMEDNFGHKAREVLRE